MVRVRVLGTVEMAVGSRRIGMNTEGLFALALYLSTRAGERIAREELLTMFWSKGTEAQQRHALRQMLYRLRQKGFSLDEEGDWVRLDSSRVDSDLRTALTDEWVNQATAAQVDAAGQFVPIFSRKVSPNFVSWLDEIRELVSAQHRKAAQRQIIVARREGRWSDLERWAQAVLRTDPLNEEATLARAESAAMAGSKTIALEILDKYLMEVGEISDDLGRPVVALRKRLAERRPDWSFRGPKEVALIGRTDLMSRLTGLVDAAWKGEGSAVVLVGAPGIGKTRLAMEARAYAELKGMRTVVVRAEAGMIERPLAVVCELGAALCELEGAVACDPDALALVRRVVEARERSQDGDLSLVRPIASHLAKALSALIHACQHERRILIVLDDMHNAGSDSLAALGSLIRQSQMRRVAWICTTRSREVATIADGVLPITATSIRVTPLSADASEQLVERTAAAHRLSLDSTRAADVVSTSAGNPLFLRELSLARASLPNDSQLPDSLQGVIAERLGRLPQHRLRTLRLVALLGGEATPARLVRLTGDSPSGLTRHVESLEDDGLLSATAAGALLLHECWQVAVLQHLTPATYCSLANECAEVLLSEPQNEASPRETWRTAELLQSAGHPARALSLYLKTADRLYDSGLPAQAADVIQRALPLADSSVNRVPMLLKLATAHLASGKPERCKAVADELLSTCMSTSSVEREHAARASALRVEALCKLNLPATRDIRGLIAIVRDSRLSNETRLTVALTAARLSANSHDASLEKDIHDVVAELVTQSPRSISGALALLIFHTEHGPVAKLQDIQQAIAESDAYDVHPAQRSTVQRLLAHSLRLSGSVEDALAAAVRAFSIARTMALPDDAALSAELATYISLDNNCIAQAAEWLSLASSIDERPGYPQRNIALRHAENRLAVQRGEFRETAKTLLLRESEIRADPIALSRATELATLAYALAGDGSVERASQIAEEALEMAGEMLGLTAGDYCHELIARVFRLVGREGDASRVIRNHVTRRDGTIRRPFAPFFRELASCPTLS